MSQPILTYAGVKEKASTLLAMTSLRREEFEWLVPRFAAAWQAYLEREGIDPGKGGRKPQLSKPEDQLLFILFYFKTYPLQEVLGHLFGISQSVTNTWIYRLSEVLRDTLDQADQLPARLPQAMLDRLAGETAQALAVDGTERRRNRPQDEALQEAHYSGKKKAHTLKNSVIPGLVDRRVKGLGQTREGRVHDKRLIEEDGFEVPPGCQVFGDSAYQGLSLAGGQVHWPMRRPPGGELTDEQKADNRLLAQVRVVAEHVISGIKRCRLVKEVFRNRNPGYADQCLEVACGLHNLRCKFRPASTG